MRTLLVIIVWSVPILASAQTPHEPLRLVTHAAIAGMLVSSGVALSTTSYALGKGTYRELNPIMRPIAGNPVQLGIAKTSLSVGMGWLILAKHSERPKTYATCALVMMAISIADAAHNAHVLRR